MSTVTAILGSEDSGSTRQMAVGDTLSIWLGENPTTGYRWAVENVDAAVLQIDATEFRRSTTGVGGGGKHCFAVTAVGTGKTRLALKHWRAWEGDKSITTRFDLDVIVVESPKQTETIGQAPPITRPR